MAQRRRLISGRTTALFGGGLLLVTLLVGMVFLSNQVTGLRRSITDLEDSRDFLESRAATLYSNWNEVTRPAVICERARRELDLVMPAEPEIVLVLDDAREGEGHGWQRFIEGLTGADIAHAAEYTDMPAAVRDETGRE